ncbi:MAG: MFS transporter [Ruminococcaceae bacterium]|nr:MFS transporter [Oscillospiraceae bacterium]MBQ8897093.1 MFS transporter [Clostridia bacterium]
MKLTKEAKKAIMIGTLCSVSYFAVYIARNIMGAVSPGMIESGLFTEESIGTISSTYFVFYAVGQLINGAIGDRVKARWMISIGLFMAGVMNLIFSRIAGVSAAAPFVYGMTGFFLAMIYGPMTKSVAENTEPIYATRCSLGFTFASFVGSPMAGVLATFMVWQSVYAFSGVALCVMAIAAFTVFFIFEKKGLIRYGQFRVEKKAESGAVGSLWDKIKLLWHHRILKFTLISVLTGIVRTSVTFWLSTYISQQLGFTPKAAASIFTAATFIISMTAFISVFVYERLKRNMDLTILVMFSSSATFFALVFLVHQPVLNMIFMVLAIMSSNGAATMLWSRYCPSLRDTGMVSGVTGFLDFMSYMGAASANLLFANAVSVIGWGNLILVWFGLMVVGVIIALPYSKFKRKTLQK